MPAGKSEIPKPSQINYRLIKRKKMSPHRYRIDRRGADFLRVSSLVFVSGIISSLPWVAEAKSAKDVVIGLSMKTHAQRRWALDEALMKAEAEKLGVKLIFQWANDSPTVQASQFEN